jgi:hypothetical protein
MRRQWIVALLQAARVASVCIVNVEPGNSLVAKRGSSQDGS